MTDVGIRELKAHLSEVVERASRGERIRITHRGRPKAVMGPISVEDRIEQGIREGWIAPARSNEPPVPFGRRRRFRAKATLDEILAEDRDED